MAKELADQGRTLIAIMERAHTDQIVSNKIRSDKPSTGGLVSQLSELSLSYGNVIALDNVSLQIPEIICENPNIDEFIEIQKINQTKFCESPIKITVVR